MGRRYNMNVVEQGGATKGLLGPTRRGNASLDYAGRPRVLVRSGVEPANDFPPTVGLATNCKYIEASLQSGHVPDTIQA